MLSGFPPLTGPLKLLAAVRLNLNGRGCC